MTSELLRYIEEKRKTLPRKKSVQRAHKEKEITKKKTLPNRKKPSQKTLEMMTSINMLDKGEAIKIPIDNEREVGRLRGYVYQHRQSLRPEVRDIHIVYKREENLLYIFRE